MTPSTDCPHGNAAVSRARALARLLGYSLIGLLVFFVPFEIGGRNTILLDHSASALLAHARPLVIAIAVLFMLYGALQPWLSGSWRGDLTRTVFSVLKVFGLLIGSIPFFIGLAVVLPILGHATWHLYRKVVVA